MPKPDEPKHSEEVIRQGAKFIIWSSMSHAYKISNGKLKHADLFDVKAEIEEYIRRLPIKSAFFAPGSFMQKCLGMQKPRPSPENDGTYVMANLSKPSTLLPLIDITDIGAWIAQFLADPEAYHGRFIAGAQDLYTLEEIVGIMSRVPGKTAKFRQMPNEEFKSLQPEPMREQILGMCVLFRDYGYFGQGMKDLVDEGRKDVKTSLNTLEKFLRKNGFDLD